MANLVFVHGVNTRSTEDYLAEVKIRDQLFFEVALQKNGVVSNSSWGDLVTTWAWNQASLPTEVDAQRDAPFSLGSSPGQARQASNDRVAAFAKKAPDEVVDEIFVQMVDRALREGRTLNEAELKEFTQAAEYYGMHDGKPLPAFTAQSDELFARELRKRLTADAPAAYGLIDPLWQLVDDLAGRAANAASELALSFARGDINSRVGRFLGDIFAYLHDDGPTRAAIRNEVIGKLQEATAKGGKLVAVGHSMGGIILYDLLSDPNKPLGDIAIDLFVTVGSQVGVFEEMKLYKSSSAAYSAANGNQVPLPQKVTQWLNVYDPVDPLSFRCSGIFNGVDDLVFSSETSLFEAHGAYFKRPRFYARLARRLNP